jgi:hypothetical protein
MAAGAGFTTNGQSYFNGSSLTGYGSGNLAGAWSSGGGVVSGFGGQPVEYRSSTAARAADPTYAARSGTGASTTSQQRLNPNPALNTQLSDTLSNQMKNPGLSEDQIQQMVGKQQNTINAGASAQQISLADKANAFGGGSSGGMLAGSRAISDNAGVQRTAAGADIRLGAAQQALQDRQQTMSTTDRYLGRLTDQSQSDARFEASQNQRPAASTSGGAATYPSNFFGYQNQQMSVPNFSANKPQAHRSEYGGSTAFTQYAPVYSGNNSLGGRDQRLSNY